MKLTLPKGADWRWSVVLVAAFVAILLINPIGLTGGGQDDGRYLAAARCWANNGVCLPHNHWQGRWPVFAPMSLAIKVFGDTRTSIQLWALLSSVIAILLLVQIGQRLFSYRVGVIAGLLLILTPAFALQILQPSVEAVELSLILAGCVCILSWRDSQHGGWAFAAGLCFGLAFQVRETSLVAAMLAFVAMFALGLRPKLAHLALAVLGFSIPLAIELMIYQQATGDPFYRRRLSLQHGQIASSEFLAPVDRSRSPILNPHYIANWRREPGLEVHWLVDGPLNLLLNVRSGFSLLLTPLLLIVAKQRLDPATRRAAWWLLGFAAAYVVMINYVLAMDPKPRVMLTGLAASTLAFALVLSELLQRGGRVLAIACIAAAAFGGAIMVATHIRPIWAERQAQAWDSTFPGQIETNPTTRSMTIYSPARAMPDFTADRPYVMVMSIGNCREWIRKGHLDPALLAVAGERRLTIFPAITDSWAWLCLFRYRQPVSATQMDQAFLRVWTRQEEREAGNF